MRTYHRLLFGLLAIPVLSTTGCSQADKDAESASGELVVGVPAPTFSLVGSDGNTHRLEDHTGRRAVVIAWFPKAFTGG